MKISTYKPLILVIAAVIALALLTQYVMNAPGLFEFMRLFMGYFFLLFGFFKVLDWNGFIMAFQEYDTLGRHSKLYAAIYPAIELGLAFLYLTDLYPIPTYIATAIVMFVGSIGVIEVVRQKKKIHCACLGAVIKLPMSTITIIEDVGMGVMALVMLTRSIL